MKTFAAILLSFVSLLPVQGAADDAPVCCEATDVSTAQVLQEVLALYDALPHYSTARYAAEQGDEECLAVLKASAAKISPMVARLKSLPVAQVKDACMLAHRVLCQGDWLFRAYLGEFGWAFEAPDDTGLDAVNTLFAAVLSYAQNEQVPAEPRAVLQEFIAACGGVQTMRTVMSWQQDAMDAWGDACQREYSAALSFFKAFCAAVSTENEAQSLLLLARQAEALQQLCSGEENELLRVNALVPAFRSALIDVWRTTSVPPKPYPNPVLPLALRTDARMQALQPFFEQLPELRTLVLEQAEWRELQARRSSVPKPDYHASIEAGDVLGIEVFLQENAAPRLVLDGEAISLEELRDDELEGVEFSDLFVRLVLEKYADIAAPEVQELMHFCESCGVSNFLLAVRPVNALATDAMGNPLYFVDVVCRISHPYTTQTWVEFYATEQEPVFEGYKPGFSPLIRVKTVLQDRVLEYRSQNIPPSVLTVAEPWSPDGEYLLLPVGLHAGYLLVREDDLGEPDFDWSQATPVNARAEWQSAPLYTSPRWECEDDVLEIHFGTGLSGEAKHHVYDVASGTLRTEELRAEGK